MFIAIGIFFVFLLLGMPVAFSIGLSGFSFFMIRDLPMTVLVQKSISTSQSFTMLAIPLFILAGNLMIRPMLGGMVATIRPDRPLMAADQPRS